MLNERVRSRPVQLSGRGAKLPVPALPRPAGPLPEREKRRHWVGVLAQEIKAKSVAVSISNSTERRALVAAGRRAGIEQSAAFAHPIRSARQAQGPAAKPAPKAMHSNLSSPRVRAQIHQEALRTGVTEEETQDVAERLVNLAA
jgi:hypothetical protein